MMATCVLQTSGAARSPCLECTGLRVERGGRCLIERIDLSLAAGEIIGLVGPNGAGKSSLLTTLAGLTPAAAGTVSLDRHDLGDLSRRQIAQRLGFLSQDSDDPYPATVLQTALIGRHPHIDFWRWESRADIAKARAALRRMGLEPFAERDIATLSGGERRRLAIAAILAQAPAIYLLDEPLEALDLAYQARLLQLLRRLARKQQAAIIMSLHDLSVAARHTDCIILLDGEGSSEIGPADTVLQAGKLSAVYGCPMRRIEVEGHPIFLTD